MNTAISSIDLIIVAAFLLLNLIVGLRYGRQVKTIRDYALGGKNFSTGTLTATIVATWTGGGFMFYGIEEIYSKGLYFVLAAMGASLGLLLTGMLGKYMGRFLENVSVAEAMGDLYGKTTQVITAISGICMSVGYIGSQFKAIAKVLGLLMHTEELWVTVLAATIVITYSTFGGIRSVTFTDVVQFFTFGTFIPFLGFVIWNRLADPHQVAKCLSDNPIFSFREVVGFTPDFMTTLGLMFFFAIPGLGPIVFQRIAMASNVTQVRRSFSYAAALDLAIFLFMVWVAILLLTASPGLAKNQIIPYLINTYTYPGLKGFFVIGVIAMAMSTADSYLNTSTVMLTNDVITALKLIASPGLITLRLCSFFLGVLGLFLALSNYDLLSLLMLSGSFSKPIFTVPLLLAIFGFRTSTRPVLIGMAAGFATVVCWNVFLKSTNSIFPGMLANLVFLLSSHYLLGSKGAQASKGIPTPAPEAWRAPKISWKERGIVVRTFQLSEYLKKNLPKNESFYFLFGIYVLTATYAAFYNLSPDFKADYATLCEHLQFATLLMTTSFVAYPIWPPSARGGYFIAWFWALSIFFNLFFIGPLLVIISGFQLSQLMIFMLNLMVAVLLLHWPLIITMAISGMGLAVFFFQQHVSAELAPGALEGLQAKVVYGLLLCSSFFIALFKHKEGYKRLEEQNALLTGEQKATRTELVSALQHEEQFFAEVTARGAHLLEVMTQKVKKFKQQIQKATRPTELEAVGSLMQEVSTVFENSMDYLHNVIYRVQAHLRLEVTTISLEQLFSNALAVFKLQDGASAKKPEIWNYTAYQELQCDAVRVGQLLINALIYARHTNTQCPILIGVQETILGYPLSSVKDHFKEITALCITVTTESKLLTPNALYIGNVGRTPLAIPQSINDLPISDNFRVVDAHYGAVAFLESGTGLTQHYIIPLRLREVRPKMMDIAQMQVGSLTGEPQEVLPEEKALIARIGKDTQADLELVQKAVATIKRYHGVQKRKSGEPFYLHPIAAAEILLDYSKDPDAIIATLLHDTVEDTSLTLSEIGVLFGPPVAAIVNKVTKLDGKLRRISMAEHENTRQLLEEEDARVLQVKLADRLHNMRTIDGHPSIAKQKQIAQETLQFFVPLARYLELKQVEAELQQLITAVMKKR